MLRGPGGLQVATSPRQCPCSDALGIDKSETQTNTYALEYGPAPEHRHAALDAMFRHVIP